ncbi:MAG: DUF3501 family protein [Marinicaulis sp.]|nr:DUF3501 family protein [Marinicaulis sp.]
MSKPTEITRDDIVSMDDYGKIRGAKRKELVDIKKARRVPIGPHATFYFESYDTMWMQIHEMLFIEKGGDEQIADELAAYNPLIPNGRELVATLMFEIDDERLRRSVLGRLGGVEETVFLKFGDEEITATAEEDVDRTTADGKASSVQFLHFPFAKPQAAAFKAHDGDVVLGIRHKNYPHMTLLPSATKAALAGDLA